VTFRSVLLVLPGHFVTRNSFVHCKMIVPYQSRQLATRAGRSVVSRVIASRSLAAVGGPVGLALGAAAALPSILDAYNQSTAAAQHIGDMYARYSGGPSAKRPRIADRDIRSYDRSKAGDSKPDVPVHVTPRGYVFRGDNFRARYVLDPTIRSMKIRSTKLGRYAFVRRNRRTRRRSYRR